ncbi:MAG: M23 family metallopeptidase [Microgenomates group bacterium]
MILNFNFNRGQLAIILKRQPGRRKKTKLQKLQNSLLQIKRFFKNHRYRGHPLSRVFRFIFENKRARKILGFNLFTIVLIGSIVSPSYSAISTQEAEIITVNPQIIQLTTEKSIRYPLDSVRITQGYHRFHSAIDFGETVGSPVYPIMDGLVEEISYQRFGYGNYIIINHGSGFKSLYAHFSKITVKKGQEVDKNTVIGLIGASGWATGPHLHLEVWDHNQPFNPLTILK